MLDHINIYTHIHIYTYIYNSYIYRNSTAARVRLVRREFASPHKSMHSSRFQPSPSLISPRCKILYPIPIPDVVTSLPYYYSYYYYYYHYQHQNTWILHSDISRVCWLMHQRSCILLLAFIFNIDATFPSFICLHPLFYLSLLSIYLSVYLILYQIQFHLHRQLQ